MKIKISHLLFLFMCLRGFVASGQSQRYDQNPCQIYGTAHVENDRTRATYFVYLETEDDYSADLRVFKEYNELYADKTGYWFFTEQKAFADFSVFFVKHRAEADFTVFFVEDELEAGCE